MYDADLVVVGRDDILGALVKPPLLSLYPKQNDRVVTSQPEIPLELKYLMSLCVPEYKTPKTKGILLGTNRSSSKWSASS